MTAGAPRREVLRHGLEVLWPSKIAGQWYCELKTHLEHAHPELEVASDALEDGEAAHEALAAGAEPVTDDQIRAAIEAGAEMRVFEWALEAEHAGVRIRGKPDMLDIAGTRARLLYEFKFSRSSGIWPTYHAQARVYGQMLAAAGLDTEELVTAVAVFRPLARDERRAEAVARLAEGGVLDELERVARMGREEMLAHDLQELTLRRQDFRIGLARFDPRLAAANLDWALAYWRGAREPVATFATAGKCRACPVNAADLCAEALAPASPALRVERDGALLRVRRA